MKRAILLAVSLLAVAFSGCSDSGSSGPPDEPGAIDPGDIQSGKGAVRGVVVDSSITPVADATVRLMGADQQTETNADGAFLFNNVEPGPYFVKASMAGFKDTQQSVSVVADEPRPPVLKMLLEPDPENRPFHEEYAFEGFLECGAGVPEVGAVNPCFLSENSRNVFEEALDSGVPSYLQAEMVWEQSSAAGTALQYSVFVPDDLGFADDFAEAQGTSPLLLRVDGDLLAANGVGSEHPLKMRVFPATTEPTAHVSQGFTIFVHVFYNHEPPESWRFSSGDPVPTE